MKKWFYYSLITHLEVLFISGVIFESEEELPSKMFPNTSHMPGMDSTENLEIYELSPQGEKIERKDLVAIVIDSYGKRETKLF
ncbi:MAG: hypothetical protein ACOYMB_01945 [Patescibacteria group bacterium]